MPKQPGSPTGIRPTRRQANAGKTLLDVRRLAAVDMYGSRGGRRRRRLILAEFALAAIDIPLLGLAIALAASTVPRVLIGTYLIGAGLNYIPLALHAISLSRAGRLDAELAGADAEDQHQQRDGDEQLSGGISPQFCPGVRAGELGVEPAGP